MGAWGPGGFANDDALDFVGGLESAAGWAPIREALKAVGPPEEETEAGTGSVALAAAELVAASRGHAPTDLPAEASAFLDVVDPADGELVALASDAVSRVLFEPSELVELWAESDDRGEWNRAVSDLIARLGRPQKERAGPAPESVLTAMVCSFCNAQIEKSELVSMKLSRPEDPSGFERGIYAHAQCLNAGLHPARLVQWWRFDVD